MRFSIAFIVLTTGLLFLGGCSDASRKNDALVDCKKQYAGKISNFDLREKVVDCMKNKKYLLSGDSWETPDSYKKN